MNCTTDHMLGTIARTSILEDHLCIHGLTIRPDSRLCHAFMEGRLGHDWDVHRVVKECCMMHWLYTCTDYPIRIDQAYTYFSYIFVDGKMVHEFVRDNVQPHIKAEIILSHGGIPTVWPWINNTTDSL